MGQQAFYRRVTDGTTPKEGIAENEKPRQVMDDGGKQAVFMCLKDCRNSFMTTTSSISKNRAYVPAGSGKGGGMYNKIAISEFFLEAEELKGKEDGKKRYRAFVVWLYNHESEYGR